MSHVASSNSNNNKHKLSTITITNKVVANPFASAIDQDDPIAKWPLMR